VVSRTSKITANAVLTDKTDSPVETPFSLFDIPDISPTANFATGTEKMVMLGRMPVFRASWGFPLTNEQIISHFRKVTDSDEEAAEIEAAILGTGFNHGYYLSLQDELASDKLQDVQAHLAAKMARQVMEKRGWYSADILIVGSSTIIEGTQQQIQAILKSQGFDIKQVKRYAQACNGALAAINDLCRMPEMHGAHAVVIGMESMSGAMTPADDPLVVRTFGNGGGSIAFVPGVDIKHIIGRTIAEYDTDGVIKAPSVYKLPPQEERIPPPSWYETVGEATDEMFCASPSGVFMLVNTSYTGKLQMRGIPTLNYFARRVPPLVVDVIGRYYQQFAAQYGDLAETLSHQPSAPVVSFVNKELIRYGLEHVGVSRKDARRLAKLTPSERSESLAEMNITDYHEAQIPWVMTDSPVNNISAGTALMAIVEMVERGMLTTNSTVPVVGFGIGSVIQADVWRIEDTQA
jgi:3-oxoacyl-[acyl-carrier-protein] synthase III